MDPWEFTVSVSGRLWEKKRPLTFPQARKDPVTGALTAGLSSASRLDVNVTTTFVELALSTMRIWNKEGDRVLKRGRGGNAPYRIVNRTGNTLQVWSEVDSGPRSKETKNAKLTDGTESEWRFDDWKTMRDVRYGQLHVQGPKFTDFS